MVRNKEMESVRSIFNEDPDDKKKKYNCANFPILPFYLILLIPSYLLLINSFTHCQGHMPREIGPVITNFFQYGLRFLLHIYLLNFHSWRESVGDYVNHYKSFRQY